MLGIKGKIIIVISFVALSSSITIGWFSICRGLSIMESSVTGNMVLQSEIVKSNFEREMDKIISTTHFLETMIQTQIPDIADNQQLMDLFLTDLEKQMRNFAESDHLLSLWVVFYPDYLACSKMISLFDKERDGVFSKEIPYDIFQQDLSSPSMDWWNKAIEHGSYWSHPYFWENWQMELISYSKAFYIDGKLAGCLGSDFDYSELKDKLSEFSDFKSGFFTLLDTNNHLIFHPRYSNLSLESVLSDQDYQYFKDHTEGLNNGIFEASLNGRDRFHTFLRLSNGWLMVANVDKDEVLSPVYRYGRFILVILGIVLIFASLISVVLAYSITSPIFRIIGSFQSAEAGKLDTRIDTFTHDELDYLTSSFNSFMDKIEQLIDDLKTQEAKLSAAMLKAEESDRLKTQFLSNISHELRTPLYAIVGFSQLLDDSDLDELSRKLYIDRIVHNNDRLLHFVEDIMTFSKLELNQLEVREDEFSIFELLQDIETNFNEFISFNPKPLQFIVRKEGFISSYRLKTDRLLLEKIINALLDNAYKFSHKGAVTLCCTLGDSFFRIYVKDTGVGIPLQYRDLIFNKFYKVQTDKSVIYGGSGMGLSIAKGITVLLGGAINVYSVVGKGSVFSVTIPH